MGYTINEDTARDIFLQDSMGIFNYRRVFWLVERSAPVMILRPSLPSFPPRGTLLVHCTDSWFSEGSGAAESSTAVYSAALGSAAASRGEISATHWLFCRCLRQIKGSRQVKG